MKHGALLALALGLIVGAGGTYLLFVRPADSRARELRLRADRLAGELEAATADYQRVSRELGSRVSDLEGALGREREAGARAVAGARSLADVLRRLASEGQRTEGISGSIRAEADAALQDLARLKQQLESHR